MSLLLQDPINEQSPSLHESLVGAFENASTAGGAFAFVTSGGVKLCLEDDIFKGFIDDGRFDLVIGIDEITNLRVIDDLSQLLTEHPNLGVKAFSHTYHQYTFHPKFCWFKNDDGGTLIIGSGNLTVNGLRNNWESFSIINLSNEEIDNVIEQWETWREGSVHFLKNITDPEVLAKAEQNIFRRKPSTNPDSPSDEEIEEKEVDIHPEDSDPWLFNDDNTVLMAEIPKGGSRWNQANFNQDSFENFFGGERWNNNYRILLREISDDGSYGDIENRQAVSVKSHNWRFELGAAAGIPYPNNGRPIGIFLKGIGIRTFLYVLALPSSSYYDQIDTYLNSMWTGPINRMRRVQKTVSKLKGNCPALPFWDIDA